MKSDSINIPKHIRIEKVLFHILPVFILLFLNKGNAQTDYRFEHIGYESGLPDATFINNIVQDVNGFIWFASAGTGTLMRYDGYKIKLYEHSDKDTLSLIKGNIVSMYLDKENNLWFLTVYGLCKYNRDKDNFINYEIFSGLKNTSKTEERKPYILTNIQEDLNGFLWLSSNDDGLYCFNKLTKEVIVYRYNSNNPNSPITDSLYYLVLDNNNNLWISTYGKGLEKFDINNKQFTHYRRSESNKYSIASDNSGKIYKDISGDIWVGLDSGRIDKFDILTGKFEHFKLDLDLTISSFYEDRSGLLWILTGIASNSIILFDKETSSFSFIRNDPLKPESISLGSTSIYQDRSGVIWIGTSGGNGLCKYVTQKQAFKYYKNEIDPARVWYITGDNDSNIWIGTRNGLNKFRPLTGRYVHYSNQKGNPNSLSDNDVRALAIDKAGILWIGTYTSGLNRFDIIRNEFTLYRHNSSDSNSIASDNIEAVFEDSFGELWIGTNSHGLDKFDVTRNVFIHHKYYPGDSGSLSSNNAKVIYEDADRILWVGSGSKGLSRYNRDNGTFKEYYNEQSITKISDICEDNNKRLWVTSFSTGLNLFDRNSGTAKTYNMNNGLLSNYIVGILCDNSGNIWLSTHHGLSCFNPDKETFRNFDEEDGLKVTNFYLNAAYKSKEGIMYFGGDGGIISFNPDSLMVNAHIPNIVLTDFKIFNQKVVPSENSPLKKNINVADEINLSYRDNSFSFEFAALDYNNPERNQYAYMMEGFDKEWINSGNIRTASYTNLDPGEYTFRVKGSNNDGIWNEEGTSIKVIITPPWWQRWWFRGFSIMLILGSLGFVRQRKLSRIRKEMRQQEEFTKQLINTQEQERERIAGELHDSLGQNLLVIKNKLLLKMQNQQELEEISNLTGKAIEEVRSISHNLRPYELDRLGLTEAIESIIDNVKSSTNLNIQFETDNIDNILAKENEINLYRIIQECITNILKHSSASEADINIKKQEGHITVHIYDNGKGFEEQQIEAGSGFGLRGISERAKLLNGRLYIESSPGKGTRIEINIPY